MTVAELRRRIDRLDAEVVRLLSERARCAVQIARLKKRRGAPVRDATREGAVLRRIAKLNGGPLGAAALERVYRRIIAACRDLEEGRR